jgi:hypothetical protein
MLLYLTDLVDDKDTTITRFRKNLFEAITEKIRNVLRTESAKTGSPSTNASKTETKILLPSLAFQ